MISAGLRTIALKLPVSSITGVRHSFVPKQGLSDPSLMAQWMAEGIELEVAASISPASSIIAAAAVDSSASTSSDEKASESDDSSSVDDSSSGYEKDDEISPQTEVRPSTVVTKQDSRSRHTVIVTAA